MPQHFVFRLLTQKRHKNARTPRYLLALFCVTVLGSSPRGSRKHARALGLLTPSVLTAW